MSCRQTCRFCGKQDHAGAVTMVRYGIRHHAHYRCYLEAGKSLADLHPWQVGMFPFRLIKERGLDAEATRLMTAA